MVGVKLFLVNSILPQTSEELFYFVTKRMPYLCGFWRFANAYYFTLRKEKGNDRENPTLTENLKRARVS